MPRPNANEYVSYSNVSATQADFTLLGGQYGVTVNGSSFGTVTLQKKSLDGSTYVTCLTAFSANGYATVNLPAGTYRIAISSTTGVYAEVAGIVEA